MKGQQKLTQSKPRRISYRTRLATGWYIYDVYGSSGPWSIHYTAWLAAQGLYDLADKIERSLHATN